MRKVDGRTEGGTQMVREGEWLERREEGRDDGMKGGKKGGREEPDRRRWREGERERD